MVKEFEIVDGFPILDEFDHTGRFDTSEMLKAYKNYTIDFRLPLKGISRKLISTTLLNVCNMFSTLYFMQTVVILKSDSIKIPNVNSYGDNGFKTVESQPIIIKFT
jgi:hypothetical protein